MNELKYVQSQERPSFDWHTFLQQTHHTDDELLRATIMAASWVTCAVGNQCARIPRLETGCPVDNTLDMLGTEFYDVIMHWYWETDEDDRDAHDHRSRALDLLVRIEQRSAYLIQKEGSHGH